MYLVVMLAVAAGGMAAAALGRSEVLLPVGQPAVTVVAAHFEAMHQPGCSSWAEWCGIYACYRCHRIVGWCRGADDENWSMCDDCAVEVTS